MAMTTTLGVSLRERRLECGLTQAELATRAGVSRQLIAAVEAGHNTPAVDAALGLARALATSVEELFVDDPSPGVVSALGGPLQDGTPLRVGAVAGRLVACEMADHGAAGGSWAKADGVLEAGTMRLFPGAAPAGLVVAGCDPALGLAEAMLQGLGSRSLLAISAPTGTAIHALKRGGVHAAVVHGPHRQLPSPPFAVVRWHLARWHVGLGVAPALRQSSFEAVLRGDVPVAQRDRAAASQQAFERAAAAVGVTPPSDGPRAAGHIDAARIAAMLEGAAVTTEGAARAFELRFLPLEQHTVEIWFSARWRDHPGIDALGDLLATSGFTERAAQFGGYDLSGCGMPVSTPRPR
jgi:DNA-binding XRE family transcriptional regulator